MEYTNRYGDVYTFTKQEDGSVLWEGDFKHCRFGWPNDYTIAYQTYCRDTSEFGETPMHIETFKEEVHNQVYDENGNWIGPSYLCEKYGPMVKSITNEYNMVDPSGGPFIKTHMDLGQISTEFKDLCVEGFKPVETGWLISTYNKYFHLADSKTIGGLTV